VLINFD
jgi:hypothetical protein